MKNIFHQALKLAISQKKILSILLYVLPVVPGGIVFAGSCVATPQQPAEITVSFRLKNSESAILNYTGPFFEPKVLKFINGSGHDTIIRTTIRSKTPVCFSSNIVSGQNGAFRTTAYRLLAQPGEELKLSYLKDMHLDLTKCRIGDIVANGTDPYYSDNSYSAADTKEKKWEAFYVNLNKNHDDKSQHIAKLLTEKKIDSLDFKYLKFNCDIHFFKKITDWLFEKNGGYFKPALDVISDKAPAIEALLNDKEALGTDEVLNVIGGIIFTKNILNGRMTGTDCNNYFTAKSINLGKFKPAFLSVILTRAKVKSGESFKKMINDFNTMYANTVYVNYIITMLSNDLENKPLVLNSGLVTLDGSKIGLAKLISSKKRFIVVDFWASWCAPCRAQLPKIDSLKAVFKSYPLEFISINIDKNIAAWRTASAIETKYLKENNYRLDNPPASALIKQLRINSIPRYLVIKGTKILSSDFYQPDDPDFVTELIRLIAN